jgi:hypothetical protein
MDNGKEEFDPIWVAPNVTPEMAEFIQSARLVMLKIKDGEGIKRAITSGKSLVQGAAAFVAMTIGLVQSKLGDLSPEDQLTAAVHLAGTIVDYAAEEGDPEAKDKKRAVEAITDATLAMLQKQGAPQGDEGMGPPQVAPEQAPMQPQAPPLMASAGG